MLDPLKAIEIKQNVWWIGFPDFKAGFSYNPYLIKDGDEVIIIDLGLSRSVIITLSSSGYISDN
ncbi:MAG: hypothetical protein ACFFDW_11400, partial [Candidatus Thorarchaeota archaeon]